MALNEEQLVEILYNWKYYSLYSLYSQMIDLDGMIKIMMRMNIMAVLLYYFAVVAFVVQYCLSYCIPLGFLSHSYPLAYLDE